MICASKIQESLKDLGLEAPRVFKKPSKEQRSKGVDITLCTDMLLHASRKHYDIAVLVSGDGDFVPLIEAVSVHENLI
ncbi:NYN domain-containing protein [Paraburkholderia sp. 31.1]|uniref:NYN domain-containing protein n=1 Tax=Paraburkholderia sp. 31.1 TaxID=2615205 RepID=UPI0016557DAB|nr:NYN domain-containing protein [Paraburkholderia sp. 31.1]